jgi:acetylornithine deacetylase/succinyl-diaminopimelate desuccinylase-like protein
MPEIDAATLVADLTELARFPTQVDLGFDTLMDAAHPRLARYVDRELAPRIAAALPEGGTLARVGDSGLLASIGTGETGRCVWLQSYTVAQHHNLMEDPFEPRIAGGRFRAQGASQNKGHQAVMLAVLRALRDTPLRGRLLWSVSREGRSSHACTQAILDALPERPQLCVLQTPMRMRLQVANRGRVDVDVHLEGRPAHSSMPASGASAIEAVAEVVRRVGTLRWPDAHPLLGERHAVVYKVRYAPQAPHTIPGSADLTIDRRLLPGDTPEAATDELREVIGVLDGVRVEVRQGVHMLPAIQDPADPGVRALQRAHAAVRGRAAEEVVGHGTFDAGGPLAACIPTVMYGAGGDGDWPLGVDEVVQARVLARLIEEELS